MPPAFIKDREALRGGSFNTDAMGAAVPHMAGQLRAHVALLSEQLADGRTFLTGERPGLVDANSYYNLWFVRSAYPPAASAFEDLPHVGAWLERVQAIGHGERIEVSRDEALRLAREADPAAATLSTDAMIGKQVTVGADDYGRDLVSGTLTGATEHQLSVLRRAEGLGEIVVHVPRIGFSLELA